MKCLYGLKRAPREWNAYIEKVLQSMGFRRLSSEFKVCMRGVGEKAVYIFLCDDDPVMVGWLVGEISKVNLSLKNSSKRKIWGRRSSC